MTGAVAAGASQAAAEALNEVFINHPELREGASRVVGLTFAGLAGGDVEKGAWVAGIADQYNRQLHVAQALALAELREKHPENAERLNAAACALAHCSASVPEDADGYDTVKQLETAGAGYQKEIDQLLATGMFDEYSWADSAGDFVLRHDEAASRTAKATESLGGAVGAVGAVGGYIGAVATAPLCVTVVGCAAPAVSLGAGTYSAKQGWDAAGEVFAPYNGTQAADVINSFDPQTHPGEATPLMDYGLSAAKGIAGFGLGKAATRLGDEFFTLGTKGPVLQNLNSTAGLPDSEAGTLVERNVLSGGPKATGIVSEIPQITLNRQNGTAFERQVVDAFDHVGGVKNTTPVTVQLSSGVEVTTIPDLWGKMLAGC